MLYCICQQCTRRWDIQKNLKLMTTIACLMATMLAVLTISLVILWRVSLTPQQNAKRLRSNGWTFKAIASRLSVSATTARGYCLA